MDASHQVIDALVHRFPVGVVVRVRVASTEEAEERQAGRAGRIDQRTGIPAASVARSARQVETPGTVFVLVPHQPLQTGHHASFRDVAATSLGEELGAAARFPSRPAATGGRFERPQQFAPPPRVKWSLAHIAGRVGHGLDRFGRRLDRSDADRRSRSDRRGLDRKLGHRPDRDARSIELSQFATFDKSHVDRIGSRRCQGDEPQGQGHYQGRMQKQTDEEAGRRTTEATAQQRRSSPPPAQPHYLAARTARQDRVVGKRIDRHGNTPWCGGRTTGKRSTKRTPTGTPDSIIVSAGPETWCDPTRTDSPPYCPTNHDLYNPRPTTPTTPTIPTIPTIRTVENRPQ